jgi:hypothetical protein
LVVVRKVELKGDVEVEEDVEEEGAEEEEVVALPSVGLSQNKNAPLL